MAVDTSQSQAALGALNSFQMPTEDSLLGAAQQKYGVQGAQDRVNTYKTLTQNLTGAIAAVDPSVTGRTSGSLVTEGQRSALVNRERAPVIGQLGTANEGLGMATSDLNTANDNVKSDVSSKMDNAKTAYQKLKDDYDIKSTRERQQQQQEDDAAKFEYQKQQDTIGNNLAAQKAYASSSKAAQDAGKGYNVKQLSSGNYNFTDNHGTPISMSQYADATGSNIMDLLRNSKSKYDQQAFKDATYWLGKGGEALAEKNLRLKYGKLF